ncbi:protein of unknown function [Methylorubrum extorquens]|uniref:Uncharacterized protein n=1 Tax=Methylorubrum extorquens TaxID=408 RepID=A0A2N9AVK2_METEX|nr:protein of unknown function [Methylorubrum extorquens]
MRAAATKKKLECILIFIFSYFEFREQLTALSFIKLRCY